MFRYLSLESSNIQSQNCAPIQCTVWPRNVKSALIFIQATCDRDRKISGTEFIFTTRHSQIMSIDLA